jgi:hypothetical protein
MTMARVGQLFCRAGGEKFKKVLPESCKYLVGQREKSKTMTRVGQIFCKHFCRPSGNLEAFCQSRTTVL